MKTNHISDDNSELNTSNFFTGSSMSSTPKHIWTSHCTLSISYDIYMIWTHPIFTGSPMSSTPNISSKTWCKKGTHLSTPHTKVKVSTSYTSASYMKTNHISDDNSELNTSNFTGSPMSSTPKHIWTSHGTLSISYDIYELNTSNVTDTSMSSTPKYIQ